MYYKNLVKYKLGMLNRYIPNQVNNILIIKAKHCVETITVISWINTIVSAG